jgi:hypothetical protein
MSGALTSYFKLLEKKETNTAAAAVVALASERQFVRLNVKGTQAQFVQHYMDSLYNLDVDLKLKVNDNQLRKAISAQVKLLEIEGLPTKAPKSQSWWVLLDKKALQQINATNGRSGQGLADAIAQAVRSPQDLAKLQAHARSIGSYDIAGGVLTGILQVVNISKTYADFDNAMSHEAVDARNRLLAGTTAIVGTVAEQTGNLIAKSMELKIARLPTSGVAYGTKFLQIGGRLGGLTAGLLIAVLDGLRGWEELQRDNRGLASLYFGSAIAGGGVSLFMFRLAMGSIGPWGLVTLVVFLVGYCFLIYYLEKEKENKIQEWLLRCYFGAGQEKYTDAKIEAEQLKLVFA